MQRVPGVLLSLMVAACAVSAGDVPAEDELARTIKVAALGDIACKPGLRATARTCNHAAVASLVDASYKHFLLLGDNQYSSGELLSYQNSFDLSFRSHFSKLKPVPGNHEYDTRQASGYFDYFGAVAGDRTKGYYSFDSGAWHLVALNTNDDCTKVACDAASAQVAWLRADLAASRRRCTLAFFHHPRFSSGDHGDNVKMAAIWDVLAANKVELVLNGHDHNYERFAPKNAAGALAEDGVQEFVVGTGGIGFRPLNNVATAVGSAVSQNTVFGLLALELMPDRYSWRFVAAGGATFADTGTRVCN